MYQLERYQADLKRFSNAQQSPEIQGGMSGSMHNPRDGYGFGALQMTHLISDKNSHKKYTPSWETNNAKSFTAVAENPLMRDHRQHRLKSSVQPPRKHEMSMTSAGSVGSFDSGRKEFFEQSQTVNRYAKKIGKSLSAPEKGGRGENFFLSSGDYGALRRAERCSQPHQEPITNTLCECICDHFRTVQKLRVLAFPLSLLLFRY
jgi:hypothetical protein